MNKVRKSFVFLLLLILVFQYFPIYSKAASSSEATEDTYIVFANKIGDKVELYQEESDQSSIIYQIPDDSKVTALITDALFTKVSYEDQETQQTWIGYVKKENVVALSQAEQFRNDRVLSQTNSGETADPVKSLEKDQTINETDNLSVDGNADQQLNPIEPAKQETKTVKVSTSSQSTVTLRGLSLQSKTNIYKQPSTSSEVLKNYPSGTILKYRSYSADWYICTVYVNGEKFSGYISASTVETIKSPQVEQTGYSLSSSTKVYSKASTDSSVLTTYSEGKPLNYKTFTSNWLEATVTVNGNNVTGYIKASEVGKTFTYKGTALKSPTKVYSKASTAAGVLKSYSKGKTLKYHPYSTNWYEATVYVNGKAVKGYIYKNDVQFGIESASQSEISKIVPTSAGVNVFSKTSTTSSILAKYKKGSVVKYKPYNNEWYQTTVSVKGKATVGYFKKTSLEKGLKGKVIVIDAGHGGHDPGANYVEKTLTLKTAQQLQALLKKAGAKVIMTRSTDVYLTLSKRVEISHINNADAFISIHYNSLMGSSAKGIELFYLPSNANEQQLANYIQAEVIKQTGLYNRGVKTTGNYHVIRENKNLAILMELGFLSNPSELKVVSTSTYQRKAATGMYKGLEKYFSN